ncbi:MAG: hypothetical protein L6435_10985 [Anaerolineae bacterium]|nr:hypothetical protein [Anaerolineae bacterium]
MAKETRLPLGDFHRYVSEDRRRIKAVFDEVEEIQYQFNDLHAQELERWKEQLGVCIMLLKKDPDQLPPALAELIATKREEARRGLQEEIDSLTQEVGSLRKKADEALLQAQCEIEALRTANPQLDRQEENLKARVATLGDEMKSLNDQLHSLGLFPLGWLTNLGKRRKFKKRLEGLTSKRATMVLSLNNVREKWVTAKKEAEERQTALRQQWEETSVEASQRQARQDSLSNNAERLSLQLGLEQTLITMEGPPVKDGELGEALQAMVQLNKTKDAYEQGLRTVAEVLGLLKGLLEGMNRFLQSVGKVYEEQKRYKLKPLTVSLPSQVAEFHEMWLPFQKLVKNEKYMGHHPLVFSREVKDFTAEHLGDDQIEAVFVGMGEALKQATKAWK